MYCGSWEKVSKIKAIKKLTSIASAITVSLITTACSLLSAPNLNQMTEYFHSDREELQIIVEYFVSSDFDSIKVWRSDVRDSDSTNIEMFTGLETGRVVVSDETVAETFFILFQRGYNVIGKKEGIID